MSNAQIIRNILAHPFELFTVEEIEEMLGQEMDKPVEDMDIEFINLCAAVLNDKPLSDEEVKDILEMELNREEDMQDINLIDFCESVLDRSNSEFQGKDIFKLPY